MPVYIRAEFMNGFSTLHFCLRVGLHHNTTVACHVAHIYGQIVIGDRPSQCQFRLSDVSFLANNNIVINLNCLTSKYVSFHILTETRFRILCRKRTAVNCTV